MRLKTWMLTNDGLRTELAKWRAMPDTFATLAGRKVKVNAVIADLERELAKRSAAVQS